MREREIKMWNKKKGKGHSNREIEVQSTSSPRTLHSYSKHLCIPTTCRHSEDLGIQIRSEGAELWELRGQSKSCSGTE